MACNESNSVNVGEPLSSHKESKYRLTSIKARKSRRERGSLGYVVLGAWESQAHGEGTTVIFDYDGET